MAAASKDIWTTRCKRYVNRDVLPEPIIIAQNGEAKMLVMGIVEYEKQQETRALLKLLALRRREFKAGKFSNAENFLAEMDD